MSRAVIRLIDQIPRHLVCAALAAGLMGPLSGCSPDTGGRVAVGGTVTLGGTLLDQGTIEFHPVGNCDGSVQTYAETIDLNLWRARSTTRPERWSAMISR